MGFFFKASITGNALTTNSKLIIDEKYRKFIEKRVHDGKKINYVINELRKKYGENALNVDTIRVWYTRFKCAFESSTAISSHNSNDNVMDSGSSSSDVIAKVEPPTAKNEPEVIFIESLLNSTDNSSTNRNESNQNAPEVNHGFDKNHEAEIILNDAVMEGKRFFVIKFTNSSTNELSKCFLDKILDIEEFKVLILFYFIFSQVPIDQVKRLYPQLLINYYENKLNFV